MRKFLYYLAGVFLIVALNQCSTPSIDPDLDPDPITELEDLKVPDGFTYDTHKTVNISIKMPSEIIFDTYRSRFDIYSDTVGGEHLL